MKRTKFSVGMRNKLASLAMDCNCCALIEQAGASRSEREELQGLIRKALQYIDKCLGFAGN